MQKQNSTYEFGKDERQNKTSAKRDPSKGNVRVLLEIEVTESLYATIFKNEDYSAEQDGEIEVTIVHPRRRDSSMKSTEEQFEKGLKFHSEKLSERSTVSASERRDVPQLYDKRQNKSFVVEKLVSRLFAAMKVGKIVGDSPSELVLKPRIKSPVPIASHATKKISHGDHCDPVPFDPKISHTKIGRKNDAAKLLRPYVDSFNNYEKRIRAIQPRLNPLVYQLHLQREDQRKCPLVEVSAAQKIVETYYAADKSSRFNNNGANFDLVRKTLMEWSSDEKRIAKMLFDDSSSLMKCEHCGVISLRKSVVSAKSCERVSKNETEDNSKGFRTFESMKNREGKLIFERPVNTDEIRAALTTDTVPAERESDSVSENRKSSDVGQKKVLKSGLPLFVANRYGQCSTVQEKSERLNEARFRNTYSPRYSPRQTIAKTVKKLSRDTSEGNRYECSFDTRNNKKINYESKSPTPLIRPSKGIIETAIPAQDEVKDKTSLLQVSAAMRKDKYFKSLIPSLSIPTKLEKTSLNIRKEASAMSEKEKTFSQANGVFIVQSKAKQSSFVPSDCKSRENESQRSLKSRTLLAGGMLKGLQGTTGQFDNLRKNISLSQGAHSSNIKKLSTNQEYRILSDDRQINYVDNGRRSFNNSKNRNPNQIGASVITDYNYSAPLIGSPRRISVHKDLLTAEHYSSEVNSPGQFTGESETTAFSSSSSENAMREWDRSFAEDTTTIDFNVDRSKAQNGGGVEKCGSTTADSKEELSSRETLTMSKPDTRIFEGWSNSTLKMTYKNPSTVVSSSSEYIEEDPNKEADVQQSSSSNKKIGKVLRCGEFERFERQIKYDEMSAKGIDEESKTKLTAKALPAYRKIVESNDKMDWETFQQLVGTLHPSQRELWCDICKAVSNEAKRVSGETGASTGVCIEINPVPTSETFTYEKKSVLSTSGNELSFEMDMILDDFDTHLEKKLSTDA